MSRAILARGAAPVAALLIALAVAVGALSQPASAARPLPALAQALSPLPNPVVRYSFDVSTYCGVYTQPNHQYGRLADGRTLVLLHEGNRKLCALAYDGTANPPVGLWKYITNFGTNPSEQYQPKFSVLDIDGDGAPEFVGMVSVPGGCDDLQVREGLTGAVKTSVTPRKADGACAVPWQESADNILHTRNYVNIADAGRIILNTEFDSFGDTWEYKLVSGALQLVWDTTRDGKARINHHYPWRGALVPGAPEKIFALTSHLDGSPAHAYYNPDGTEGGPVMTLPDPTDHFTNHLDKCAFDGTYAYCSREFVKLIKFDATTKSCEISGTADAKISGFGDFIPTRPGKELLIDETGQGNGHLWDPATCTDVLVPDQNVWWDDCITFDYDGDVSNGEECLKAKQGGAIQSPILNQKIDLQFFPGAPQGSDGNRAVAAPVALFANSGSAEQIAIYNGTRWAVLAHPTASGTGNRWSDACYARAVASGEYDTHPERNYDCSFGGGGPVAPPAAPTGLTATAGDKQNTLSWTASTGATSYNVLRSTTSGGPYTTIATGVTATTYTDTGLCPGTTQFYVAQAVNAGGTSPNSNQSSATPSGAPAAPTNLTATAGGKNTHTINLSWTGACGATSYNVLRSTTSGGPYTTLATGLSATSYSDSAETTRTRYFFVVQAVSANGTSPNSNQVSARSP